MEQGGIHRVTVYLGSNPGKDEKYSRGIRELGQWIARKGYELVYGGSKVGLMGLIADAVLENGGRVVGVEPGFFVASARQHEGLSELIVTEDMAERKKIMASMGDICIAFPGGCGTLEEISEIMSHNGIGLIDKLCVVYNLDHFYDGLQAQIEVMCREGFILPKSASKIHFVRDLDELEALTRQYRSPSETD